MTGVKTENRFLSVSKQAALEVYFDVTDFSSPATLPNALSPEEVNSLGVSLKSAIIDLPGLFPEIRANKAEFVLLKSVGSHALSDGDLVTVDSVMIHADEHLRKRDSFLLRLMFGHEFRKRQVV